LKSLFDLRQIAGSLSLVTVDSRRSVSATAGVPAQCASGPAGLSIIDHPECTTARDGPASGGEPDSPSKSRPLINAGLRELRRSRLLIIYTPQARSTLDRIRDAADSCPFYANGSRRSTAALPAERDRMVFEWAAAHTCPVAFVLAGGYVGDRLSQATLVDLHRHTMWQPSRRSIRLSSEFVVDSRPWTSV
jgi:hypothetical protein